MESDLLAKFVPELVLCHAQHAKSNTVLNHVAKSCVETAVRTLGCVIIILHNHIVDVRVWRTVG